jgi:hypothetical protein
MATHDHDENRSATTRHRVPRHEDGEPPAHPLLDLQQQAGNAAVTQLLAVQRHSLDPEEEAGS